MEAVNFDGKNRINFFLYFSAFAANLATLSVGGSCVWSSPAIPRLNGKIDPANNPLGSNITSSQESWIASLYPLGASISAILSGFLTDKIGRKSTLLISSLPTIAGFGLLTFGASVHEFYFGRFFTGLGSGTVFTVIPIYIAEIAENDNRGRLGCLLIFFITIGNLMTYISAPHLTLKVLTGCNLAVPIIFLILFGIFVPESPYYYVGKKRYSKAEKSLLKLRRGRPEIVKTELVAIIKSVQESYANKVNFEEIRNDKALVRGFYICLGLVCFQQLSGINVIFFYMQSIFESSKIAISSDNCTIIVGTMQFLSSASTLSLVDKYGRRVLLLISAAGSAVSLLATGIYFYLLENSSRLVEGINWIPLVTINFFVVSYTLGFGPVAFAMIGEVFPPHIKSRAATICIFCSLMSTFCITNIFPYFKEWIGMGPSFCLLGIICCISGAFVYFKVPETKKKSLREVQELLRY